MWKYNDYGIVCNFPFLDNFLPEPDNIREALQGVLGTWEHMDESATVKMAGSREHGREKHRDFGSITGRDALSPLPFILM